MKNLTRFFLHLMGVLYLLAGLNHFFRPGNYIQMIPPYLPHPELLNYLAGIAELILGLGIQFTRTRRWSAWGIIAMLVAFLPAHIYFIEVNSCIPDGICLPTWTGWIRLVIIHPLLIVWAYCYTHKI